MDCIFCEIMAGKSLAYFVYEDEKHVAILDRYPIHRGHTLVMPRVHHERIIDMPPEGVSALFTKIISIARGVIEATQADGFNIGQNNGRAANQIIPHVHVHIIPRYSQIGTAWPKRKIADKNELADLASKIRKCIKFV